MNITWSLRHADGDIVHTTGDKLYDNLPLYIDGKVSKCVLPHQDGEFFFTNTTGWYWATAKAYRVPDSGDQRFGRPPKGTVICFTQTDLGKTDTLKHWVSYNISYGVAKPFKMKTIPKEESYG